MRVPSNRRGRDATKTVVRIAGFLAVALGLVTDAAAQEMAHPSARPGSEIAAAVDTAPARTGPVIEAGAFEKLSAANQKLTEAIFNGQSVTSAGSAPMNLDQIATMHRLGGWKMVFSRMKAKGLTAATTVRELLAGAKRQRTAKRNPSPVIKTRVTVVTNGAGHRIIVYRKAPSKARAPSGERRSSTARDGSS